MNKEEPTVWANTVSHVYVQIFYVEHLAKASRRRRLRLVRTIPGHLMRTSQRRSSNLVKQVYVEHLVKASRRRRLSLEIRKSLEIRVTIQNPFVKPLLTQRSLLMWLLRHINYVKCSYECEHSTSILSQFAWL